MEERKKEAGIGVKARELLSAVDAGERLSTREWAQRLYGDSLAVSNIYAIVRRLRKQGYHVASGSSGGPLGYATDTVETAEYATQRMEREVRARITTLSEMLPEVLEKYPELAETILPGIKGIHFMALTAQSNLKLAQESYGSLQDGKNRPALEGSKSAS